MEQRLYIVGRADLGPGLRAAQVGHAAFAFAIEHPDITRRWHPNYLILLEAKDLSELKRYERLAKKLHVKYSSWQEPDLCGELTALAFAPSWLSKKLCSRLPLLMHDQCPDSSMTRAPVSKTGDESLILSRDTVDTRLFVKEV